MFMEDFDDGMSQVFCFWGKTVVCFGIGGELWQRKMENVEQVPKIEERLPAQFGNGKGSPFIVNIETPSDIPTLTIELNLNTRIWVCLKVSLYPPNGDGQMGT